MKPTSDPERWIETHDELTAQLGPGLLAYTQLGPDAAQRARLWSRLSPAVGTAAEHATRTPISPIAFGKALACVLCLLAAWAAWVWYASSPSTSRSSRARHATAARALAPAARATTTPAATPAQVTEPAPARQVRAKQHGTRPSNAAPDARPATGSEVAELELLTRARRVLFSEPARALALAERHAGAYPKGVFSEEREVIAIDALTRLGRRAEADRRARDFMRMHPTSAYRGHIGALLDAR